MKVHVYSTPIGKERKGEERKREKGKRKNHKQVNMYIILHLIGVYIMYAVYNKSMTQTTLSHRHYVSTTRASAAKAEASNSHHVLQELLSAANCSRCERPTRSSRSGRERMADAQLPKSEHRRDV